MESANNMLTGLMRLKTFIRTFKSVALLSISIGMIVFAMFFSLTLYLVSDEIEINSTAAFYKSKYSQEDRVVKLATEGGYRDVYAKDILSSEWVGNNVDNFESSLYIALVVGCIMASLGIGIFIKLSSTLGGNRFIRGGKKEDFIEVDEDEVAFNLGIVAVRHRAAKAGAAIIGDSGTGKSQAIMAIISQFVERNEKALIYDRTGDLTEAFYREGRDIILNPFDSRMPYWSIFNELETEYDPERLARSFCPSSQEGKKNSNIKYWEDTPMQVLADLLRKLALKGDCSHSSLLKYLLPSNIEALNELLDGCQSQASISPENEKVALSVLSTLSSKLGALAYIEADERAGFSIRKWASDPTDDRRIFLTVNKNQQEISNSIITFWADTILSEVLSLSKEKRVNPSWYVFDEFQSLERMQSITDGLNEIRKMNGRIILSVTSLPILKSIYGEDSTNSMLSTCGVKLIFQNGDPKSAVYLSDLLSKEEVFSGRVQMRDKGQSDVGDNKEETALFSSSEIQNLGDLKLVIKQSELPLVSTKIGYKKYPSIAVGMVEKKGVEMFPAKSEEVIYSESLTQHESYDEVQYIPDENESFGEEYAAKSEGDEAGKPRGRKAAKKRKIKSSGADTNTLSL